MATRWLIPKKESFSLNSLDKGFAVKRALYNSFAKKFSCCFEKKSEIFTFIFLFGKTDFI